MSTSRFSAHQVQQPLTTVFLRLAIYFTTHHTCFTIRERFLTAGIGFIITLYEDAYIFTSSNKQESSPTNMNAFLEFLLARFRQRVKPPEISTL